MRESPRVRRLRADYRAMQQLRAESSILNFEVPGALYGGPPESYRVQFFGKGLWRPEQTAEPRIMDRHEVTIHLGASYPRMMPELAWRTPVFHPNISAGGVVCLGGYSTHWVPSLTLDELCTMLWDMVRYKNYDVDSPYNRDAAAWARSQQRFRLPVDARSIRDKLVGSRLEELRAPTGSPTSSPTGADRGPADDVLIIDDPSQLEIVEAEVIAADQPDILFLD
ncbi:MAG: hypothetical protein J5I93_21165 [Pirellulaceae bacterium]|nr:hypothetical protein [Pirellulaceae bacterium]